MIRNMYYNFTPSLKEPLCFIHPYQLEAVLDLLSYNFPPYIDYIILFGGSLDLACHVHSDIDLFVISEIEDPSIAYDFMHKICTKIDRAFDVLISNKEEFIENSSYIGNVEYNVIRGGVLIYDKEKNNIVG